MNISIWNRINLHVGFWEKKCWKMEFQPLGHESSPFCRTKWFHIGIKIAFFHLSVCLIGQGGWKFCCRPWFYSWQTVQFTGRKVVLGSKLQNSVVCNWYFFLNLTFNAIFKWTYKTASFHHFGFLVKAMQHKDWMIKLLLKDRIGSPFKAWTHQFMSLTQLDCLVFRVCEKISTTMR